jgi:hypothetical protein
MFHFGIGFRIGHEEQFLLKVLPLLSENIWTCYFQETVEPSSPYPYGLCISLFLWFSFVLLQQRD